MFKIISRFVCYPLITLNKEKYSTLMMESIEEAKQLAAYSAVDENVMNNTVVGIGSGSTVVYAVKRLVERIKKEKLNIVCVPTSFQARQLIIENKLKLGDLETHPKIDCTIDGADEVDQHLRLIKGGGGCLTQEKIVAHFSKKLIIIADYTKRSTYLTEKWKTGIPIEVIPCAYKPIKIYIMKNFDGVCNLRMAKMKVGPVVTDNGNFILDWKVPHAFDDWDTINSAIIVLPGVVETGLFLDMTYKAYFGLRNGSVEKVDVPDISS